jgi:hypothetical protein
VDRIDHLKVEEDEGVQHVVLILTLRPRRRPEDVVDLLTATPGVRNVDWTR